MSDYDYTDDNNGVDVGVEDFKIAAAAPIKSAEEIEAESGSFEEIPPGTHELVIVGFLNKPKAERKEVYVDKHRVGFDTHSVVVKFALPADRNKQVTDFFLLPPADPHAQDAYNRGSKGPEGKAAGFNANKFYHFMERIGFVAPRGGSLPPEACRLGNWIGRNVIATVAAGDPYTKRVVNTETGEEEEVVKAGRNQIKLFSYRAAGSTQANYQRPAAQAMAGAGQARASTRADERPTGQALANQVRSNFAHGERAEQIRARDEAAAARPSPDELRAAYKAAIEAEDFDRAKALKAEIQRLYGGNAQGQPSAANRPAPRREPAMAGAGAHDDRGLDNM